MQERIDLVVVTEEKRKTGGLSISVLVSLILHASFLIWFITRPSNVVPIAESPMVRYVELLRQNPQDFVEAPGPEVSKKAPLTAPLSDKNRKASMPEPTGPNPTTRPGDGSGYYKPAMTPGSRSPEAPVAAQQAAASSPLGAQPATSSNSTQAAQAANETFTYREPTQASAAAPSSIDWRSAIKSVRGPIGGGEGVDSGRATGGELGTAEQGPISFETQWFDWGPYSQQMVSRIRVNWYANMPQLIRTGIGGVVTIRFTIQRDGRVTDITVLKSSGHPPYDFAARKAIELSSPLQALPANFPNANERVTAMFYYNTPLP